MSYIFKACWDWRYKLWSRGISLLIIIIVFIIIIIIIIIIINSFLSLSQLYLTMMISQTLIEDITWLRRDAKKYFYTWLIWHLVFVFM